MSVYLSDYSQSIMLNLNKLWDTAGQERFRYSGVFLDISNISPSKRKQCYSDQLQGAIIEGQLELFLYMISRSKCIFGVYALIC